MLSKGSKNSSSENVVGFPVFGTVLAYQKLYGTDNGVRAFAETTAKLSEGSFNLPPVGVALTSPASINAFRAANLQAIAPYASRNLEALTKELVARAAGTSTQTRLPKGVSFSKQKLGAKIRSMSNSVLKSNMSRVVSGDVLASFIASFVLFLHCKR